MQCDKIKRYCKWRDIKRA